jgi:hypothetical protein
VGVLRVLIFWIICICTLNWIVNAFLMYNIIMEGKCSDIVDLTFTAPY